ncbi:hypothetical protein QLX08_009782 [Tetragonisca angustula]|uniref:beta-glucosidase n=1 Tax=Tetragonisca angustula TaxID=166442 RepID=A0AAW0ZF17_9HYME
MSATFSLGISILLLLVAFSSSTSGKDDVVDEEKHLRFPPNFVFGAATAAYQIEGAWNVSGKGESTWDRLVHEHPDRIYNGDTGDVAANSYYQYKEDVAILKKLGFKSYRFSISWPRILPTGFANKINAEGIQYYHNLIDELKDNGIEPMLTLYHWDHPQVLEDMGGWLNDEMVYWFGDYASIIFREYGSKVKKFVTINEPKAICKNGYSLGIHAPGKRLSGLGEYMCIHNVLKSHAVAYRIYDSEFRSKFHGEVGVLVDVMAYMPENFEFDAAAETAFQFNIGWTMHPIFSKEGDYPPAMKQLVANRSKAEGFVKSRLPVFDEYWVNFIRGSADFLAVNHYTSRLVVSGTMGQIPSHEHDQGVREIIDSFWKSSASNWLKVVPVGFRYILVQLAKNYGNPPMYITENGVSDLGTLNDDDRIYYYREYLKQMLIAIYEDGVDIRGYYLWSLLDNFEWNAGYRERFGIVFVDYEDPNRQRMLKKSASWWQQVIAAGKIETN